MASDTRADLATSGIVTRAPVTARFQLLTDTGHMPQIETPGQLLQAIWDCV